MPARTETESSDESLQGMGVLSAIRRFPGTVLAAVVIATLLGALLALAIPVRYSATAQVVLGNPNDGTVFRSVPILNATAAAQSATQIMRSGAVHDRASVILKHKISPSAVSDAVSVTPGAEGAPLVTITATRDSASDARDLADAEGQAYLDVTNSQVAERAARARAALKAPQDKMKAALRAVGVQLKTRVAQIKQATPNIPNTTDRARFVESALNTDGTYQSLRNEASTLVTNIAAVTQTIQESEVDATLSKSGVDMLYGASLPSDPRSSNLRRDIVITAVLGFLIGAALAWRRLDRSRGADRRQITALLDAPLLGTVRGSRELSSPSGVVDLMPGNPIGDDFRVLASTLILDLRRRGLDTCVITSVDQGAGKTVLALNIAAAADYVGYDVVLVDLDVLNPTLTQSLSTSQPTPTPPTTPSASVETGAPAGSQPFFYTRDRSLSVVSARMHSDTAKRKSQQFDTGAIRAGSAVTVVDTPSFFADPMSLVLASEGGAGLVVVVSKESKPDDMRAMRARADSAGATILGFLVNDHATRKPQHREHGAVRRPNVQQLEPVEASPKESAGRPAQ